MAVVGGIKDFSADVFDFFDTPRNDNEEKTTAYGRSNKQPGPTTNQKEKHGGRNTSSSFKQAKSSLSFSSNDSESEIETESVASYTGKRSPVVVKGETYSSDSFTDTGSSSAYSDSSSDSEDDIIETERERYRQQKNEHSTKGFGRPSDLQVHSKQQQEAWSTEGISRVDIHPKGYEEKTEERNIRPKSSKFRTRENGNERQVFRDRSGSDSEMTDVSPLSSPRDNNSPSKSNLQYTDNDDSSSVKLDSKKIDLSVLMEAVEEIEKERARQERLKVNSRRVMFAPPKNNSKQEKANYTYDKARTNSIEKENQRLLKQIMRNIGPKQKGKPEAFAPRLTPSAVNRRKEQQRIESENMAFLQRLKSTRSTRGMSRTEQLTDYKKTLLYGVPITAVQPYEGAMATMDQRTRSMNSVFSSTSTHSHRRPSSAKSNASSVRPGSAKSTTSTLRPGSAKSVRSVCSSVSSKKLKSDYKPAWNNRFAYT